MDKVYYKVILKVFAFDSKEEAQEYANRLVEVFCDMPESEPYASFCRIEEGIEE